MKIKAKANNKSPSEPIYFLFIRALPSGRSCLLRCATAYLSQTFLLQPKKYGTEN